MSRCFNNNNDNNISSQQLSLSSVYHTIDCLSDDIIHPVLIKLKLISPSSSSATPENSKTTVMFTTVLCMLLTGVLLWCYIVRPLFARIHESLFAPLHRIVDMECEKSRKIRRRKRIGEYPPVFPNGWFKVCDSRELSRGQVLQRSICGVDMAVFRSESSNEVYAIDLYCTHLGANLAVGGQVKGNCLVCPFHHWSFSGESGKCVSNGETPHAMPILNKNGSLKKTIGATVVSINAPVAGKNEKLTSCDQVGDHDCEHNGLRMPLQAHSKKYHIIEKNQMIWLWNHAEGDEPSWQLPDISSTLLTHGKCEHHVYCHVQEIPENGPDVAHLGIVHAELQHTNSWVKNIWGATWRAGEINDEKDRHIGHFRVQHVSTFKNWFNIPFSTVDVIGCQLGPGVVMFDFNTPVGMFVMVQTVTPVGPLHQQVEHVIFTPWYLPRFFGKWFMIMMTSALEQDVPIWNNKTYFKNPVLSKKDGPIASFRRWYSQFYTDNSPTLKSLNESSLDW